MGLVENIYVTEDVTLFSLCDAPADVAHMAEVFAMIAKSGIDVDMISQLPISGSCSGFSFTVSGEAMRGTPGVSARVFKAAASVGADVRMITTSEIEIALLVVKSDVDTVIDAINKEFAE